MPLQRSLCFLLVLAACVGTQPTEAEVADRPPNIVVILADDLGQGDLALYDGWLKTPRLEQMAREGIVFNDFHTNSSVCSPTRAAFLTGRYQQRLGIVDVIVGSREPDQGLRPTTPTIPRLLKDNGYSTALFGKWHCGYQPEYNPVHHGFDEFVGFLTGGTDYHRFGGWRDGLERAEGLEGYATQVLTDKSVDFIKRNRDKPFFLYVSHAAVHNPYQTPADTPENRDPNEKKHALNDKNRERYAVMLAELDKGVGAILDTLKELGLAEDTFVFFFSDNGAVPMRPRDYRRLRGGKFSQYEGGHRVPAIAWWPKTIPTAQASDALVMGFDLFPTIADITGLAAQAPDHLDGVSIRQHLIKQAPLPDRDIFFGYEPKLGTAMRRGPWKMIVKNDDVQLYNLDEDIREQINIAELHPDITRSMREAIEHFKKTVTPGS